MPIDSQFTSPLSDLLADAALELESGELPALAHAVMVARATIIEQTQALGRPLMRLACPNPDASSLELAP
jgi:hypothetical protein